jgi:glutaredoxin
MGEVYSSAMFRGAIAALFALPLAAACNRSTSESKPAAEPPAAAKEPPQIRVTADRKDLVFSYAGEGDKGYQTATAIQDVPESARRSVIVMDLSLTPEERQSGRYIYVADLRAARADGTYPVAVASRYGFEAKLAGTSTASGSGSGKEVVVYSAAWCGVCKHAKQLLKTWGVRFSDKDIEASKSAAEELAMKAQAAGIRPGGVPVIDVGGTLLQGLDEGTLRGVLKEKGFLR